MKLDAVTLEVLRNALPAVANEMAADLQRTSYNMMIYEVRDYCTALLDTNGELISQNVGGVSHFVADLGVLVTKGRMQTADGLTQRCRQYIDGIRSQYASEKLPETPTVVPIGYVK